MKKFHRRHFLLSLLTLPGAATAAIFSLNATDATEISDELRARVEAIIGPPNSLVTLGKAVAEYSQEADLSPWSETFLQQLCSARHAGRGKDYINVMKSRYHNKIARDFDSGETARLEGWVLSRTEMEISLAIAGILSQAS